MIPDPTEVGDVYDPAEDSALLAEAAFRRVDPGDRVLDVGTGSGYVAGAAAAAGARVVATDLNPHACRRARADYGPGGDRLDGLRERFGDAPGEDAGGVGDGVGGVDGAGTVGDGAGAVEPPTDDGHDGRADGGEDPADGRTDGPGTVCPVEVVRADLVGPFRDGAFDAVTFNPPYLPTDPDAERDDWMARALSGGEDGLAVVRRFLPAVGRVLAPGGTCLLVASSLGGVDDVAAMAGDAGLAARTVAEESFPFETLAVLALDA